MDATLTRFGDSLTPKNKLMTSWDTEVHSVIRKLKKKLRKRYKFDRNIIGGSMRKKTAVIQADYDCVIFLNDRQPPFDDVLEDFKRVLDRFHNVSCALISPRAVQFTLNDEVHVDLLPASNLVRGDHILDTHDRRQKQREKVLDKMSALRDAEARALYQTSLAESSVAFMKEQSTFVHVVVKLTKLWYKLIQSEHLRPLFGLKYLLEIAAVYYARKEENDAGGQRSVSVIRALETLFERLSNLNRLQIRFDNSPFQTLNHNNYVIDPCNPFCDILAQVNETVANSSNPGCLNLFREHASHALNVLRQCLRDPNSFGDNRRQNPGQVYLFLTTLFESRAYNSLRRHMPFAIGMCFSCFPSYKKYVLGMRRLKVNVIPEDKISENSIIENAFHAGVLISAIVSEEPVTDSRLTFERKYERILNYMQIYPEFGSELPSLIISNGDCVIPFASLSTAITEFRSRFGDNTKIFHAPMQRGRNVFDGRTEALYCCFLFLLER